MGALAGETRRTLALALPISAGHLGQMLMGWADTVMIGRTGTVALAACSFANTVLMVPAVFAFGVVSATAVRASLAKGAGEKSACAAAYAGGARLALAVGVGISLLALAVLPLLSHLGQPAEVVETSRRYFLLCAFSLVLALLSTVSKNVCEALSRPWLPFWILLGAVLLNVLLNWILIFGNWGAPALGIEGAGWATLIARTVGAVAMLMLPVLNTELKGWMLGGESSRFSPAAEFQAQVVLGFPVGAMNFAEASGFAAGSLAMGWISAEALAAHQIALTCAGTSFMTALGVAQATCVRVGQKRGAGSSRGVAPVVAAGLRLACLIMGTAALVFLMLGRPLAHLFTSDAAVADLTVQLLVIAGFFQLFDGVQVVCAGALRGFEDTRVPMVIGALAYWVLALPVGCLLAFGLGWGGSGIWSGFLVGLLFSAVALLLRVQRRLRACSAGPEF